MAKPIDFVIGVHKNGVVVDERHIMALTEREALMAYAHLLIAGGHACVVAGGHLNLIYKQFALGSPVSWLARKAGKYVESMATVDLEGTTSITPRIARIVKGTDWL